MRHNFVIGFTGPYRNRRCLFIHFNMPYVHYNIRWQRPYFRHLTLDLIRGRYNGKYSIYDIF